MQIYKVPRAVSRSVVGAAIATSTYATISRPNIVHQPRNIGPATRSTTSRSFVKRFTMRPTGVMSKNHIGVRSNLSAIVHKSFHSIGNLALVVFSQ